jgi:general stress protein 26
MRNVFDGGDWRVPMGSRTQHKSEARQLSDKIKDVRVAMMTTIEPTGGLHSRPMITQDMDTVEFDGNLWFLTSASSPKAANIQEHQHVNISYSKPDKNLFVSVSGTAQIVDDRKKIKDLWSPMAKAWFQSEPENPDIVSMRVHVTNAEYWDAPAGKMGGLFKLFAPHDEQVAGADVKLDMH